MSAQHLARSLISLYQQRLNLSHSMNEVGKRLKQEIKEMDTSDFLQNDEVISTVSKFDLLKHEIQECEEKFASLKNFEKMRFLSENRKLIPFSKVLQQAKLDQNYRSININGQPMTCQQVLEQFKTSDEQGKLALYNELQSIQENLREQDQTCGMLLEELFAFATKEKEEQSGDSGSDVVRNVLQRTNVAPEAKAVQNNETYQKLVKKQKDLITVMQKHFGKNPSMDSEAKRNTYVSLFNNFRSNLDSMSEEIEGNKSIGMDAARFDEAVKKIKTSTMFLKSNELASDSEALERQNAFFTQALTDFLQLITQKDNEAKTESPIEAEKVYKEMSSELYKKMLSLKMNLTLTGTISQSS